MKHNIDERKVIDLIKAICARIQDVEGYLNKTKLIKYLYLIDMEYYRIHKKTFTGFNWIFYNFGPWAYEYNEIFANIVSSDDFIVRESADLDYDSHFITVIDRKEFEDIFEELEEPLIMQRIVNRWADEHLNSMLNYIYFYTEPMQDAKKNERLDFSKIHKLEAIPKFKLSKTYLEQKDIISLRKNIRKGIKQYKAKKLIKKNPTPAKFDDMYWDGIEKLNNDNEY